MDQSFGCHKNFKKSLVSTPFGCKWNQSSETEANGHWRKSVKNWQQALGNALTFGTHKGVPTQPVLLKKLISKDVIHGNSLPVPLLSVKSIPGLVMAPMNIMVQNTINGIRQVIPKAEPKKSPPSMPFWFLHPPDCHHGSCCKNYLPQQVHPCNRNRLQVGLPSRASSLVDSPLNLHPTLQQQYCNHWATSHFWRRTMSVWMGNNVRNNLQLNKWIK